ncbi:MAG: hypothetical protein AAF682_23560 [Planctomycetota bacterium]
MPLVLAPAGGDEGTYSAAKAEAVTELFARLEEHVAWCGKSKLFAERDRAYRAMLALDPACIDAHKGLGHRKGKSGDWEPHDKRKPPKNRNPRLLPEAAERWGGLVAPYRDRVLTLLDEHDVSHKARGAEHDALLALDPEDATIRALFGEARLEDRWVLQETLSGKKRRPELNGLVRAARERVPAPKRIEPDAHEAGLGVEWKAALSVPAARVLTTGDEDEALAAAQAVHVAGALFERVFGEPAKYPRDYRLLLLAAPQEKDALLDAHPDVDPRDRAFLGKVLGAGVPATGDFYHAADAPAKRRDGAVRMLLGMFLLEAYGISTKHGWAHEGFGLYLTRSIVGTRMNWFAMPSRYVSQQKDAAFRAKLYHSDTNWMNEAHLMLQREQRPTVKSLLGKDVNTLGTEELLLSYVTAAYLIEGRPEAVPDLLRRIGAGENPAAAIEAALGMNVLALDERIRRWLSERR